MQDVERVHQRQILQFIPQQRKLALAHAGRDDGKINIRAWFRKTGGAGAKEQHPLNRGVTSKHRL